MFQMEDGRKREKKSDQLTGRKSKDEETASYPVYIQRRLQGFDAAIIIFLIFGLVSWIITKSLLTVGFGFLLAAATFALKKIQTAGIKANGYEVWEMEILEYTYLTRLHRRPTGIYAEALDGPYKGNVCHIALQRQGVLPPVGRIVEVCVPGNTQANLIRDVYYVPQYYGMELTREE